MKTKLLYILIPALIAASCSSNARKEGIEKINPEITLQTTAVFKSAEHVNGNDWKLIFRKLDDCQYIVFYSNISKMITFKDIFISSSGDTYITNPDFINSRFTISYIEETAPDPITGENSVNNILKNINRSQSNRFAEAGFISDTEADDFIITLKKYVKSDSVLEISKMIFYPQNVVISKKRVKLSDPETFINNYSNIFNNKIKNSILNQTLADVKSTPKGVIIGASGIQISRVDNKIFITSISN